MWSAETNRQLVQMLQEMIRIDTSNLPGNERKMTDYIADCLEQAGISYQVIEKKKNRSNLIAKLPATVEKKEKPLLLLSHIDVVPAQGEWEQPPFSGNIEDGVLYGRGAIDTKHLTAMELMTVLLLQKENGKRNRDVYLIASADEEKGSEFGMKFLSEEHREFIPDGYTISEGGGFVITQSGQRYRTCTCGEKGEASITVTGRGEKNFTDCSHSTAYRVLEALEKISSYEPKETLCRSTKQFCRITGKEFSDPTMKNLWEYSTRDNLVVNAFTLDFSEMPSEAMLHLSYKFIPGTEGICYTDKEEGKEKIGSLMKEILKDSAEFEVTSLEDGYECEMENEFITALEKVSDQFNPGVRLLPIIALGRTDGRFIGKNVYGYSPMLEDQPFSEILKIIHRENERITLNSLIYGGRVIYETVKSVCSQKNE